MGSGAGPHLKCQGGGTDTPLASCLLSLTPCAEPRPLPPLVGGECPSPSGPSGPSGRSGQPRLRRPGQRGHSPGWAGQKPALAFSVRALEGEEVSLVHGLELPGCDKSGQRPHLLPFGRAQEKMAPSPSMGKALAQAHRACSFLPPPPPRKPTVSRLVQDKPESPARKRTQPPGPLPQALLPEAARRSLIV